MAPSVDLQKTIYNELETGGYPVREIAPAEVKEMPLITLSELNRETDFTKTNKDRFTYTIMIHGWSIGKSSLESKTIEEFIYQTMMILTTTRDYKVEMVNLLMTNNVREDESADRVTFHSIQQFGITISKYKGED